MKKILMCFFLILAMVFSLTPSYAMDGASSTGERIGAEFTHEHGPVFNDVEVLDPGWQLSVKGSWVTTNNQINGKSGYFHTKILTPERRQRSPDFGL